MSWQVLSRWQIANIDYFHSFGCIFCMPRSCYWKLAKLEFSKNKPSYAYLAILLLRMIVLFALKRLLMDKTLSVDMQEVHCLAVVSHHAVFKTRFGLAFLPYWTKIYWISLTASAFYQNFRYFFRYRSPSI